ncbi:hypothetical protein W822_08195 [Advenella kashmirensis W13003]|uniref:GTP-binding protein YdgA n=2 Tax=Advenella kashmirensis TaxID=310575 RepID=V8QU45_9BURK|nr:hypothetical protein W822_08195 [Advenella kashmirensis W13003]
MQRHLYRSHIIYIMSKKITKALAAVVLLVILGYFGGTWYTGTQVDEQIVQRTQTINAQLRHNGLPVQISTEKKDSGLFTSSYILSLRIDGAGQSHTLNFDVEIEHGPLPLSRLQQGKLQPVQAFSRVALINDEKTANLFELSQGRPPLDLTLTTRLDGSTHYEGNLAPLSFNNSRDGQLHFDGLSFSGTLDASNRLAQFSGNMPLLQVSPPPNENGTSTLIFRDMALSSHFDGRQTEASVLQQQSTLAELSLANEQTRFEIRDYRSDTESTAQNDALTAAQNTTLNSVRVNGIDLGKLQYGVTARGLDRAGVAQFMTQAWQLMLDNGRTGSQAVPQEKLMPLLASLDLMFSGEPTLTIGPMIWTLPEGQATATVDLSLNNPVPLLSQFGNDAFALLLNSLRSARVELQADDAMPPGAAKRLGQLRGSDQQSQATPAGQSDAQKLQNVIDILVKNKLLSRNQGHVGLSFHVEGEPSLAAASDIDMNGESFDTAGLVTTLRERATAAERQIRELTPAKQAPAPADAPAQD